MIVLIHVLIALTSIIFSSLLVIFPSKTKLRLSYLLIGLTLASGTLLVITTHVSILKTCISGLIYLAFVMSEAAVAWRRLEVKS